MLTNKEEKAILSLLPIVVMWIKDGTDLTEQEIRTAAKLHPQEFEFARTTSTVEIRSLMEKYKDGKFYRDLIEIILSEKGWNWVERTTEKCKKMPPIRDNNGPANLR
jgi:hypothetical protein